MAKKALTRTEITNRSEEKRGVKTKGFKLSISDIELIEQLSKEHDIAQSTLVVDAIKFYKENHLDKL